MNNKKRMTSNNKLGCDYLIPSCSSVDDWKSEFLKKAKDLGTCAANNAAKIGQSCNTCMKPKNDQELKKCFDCITGYCKEATPLYECAKCVGLTSALPIGGSGGKVTFNPSKVKTCSSCLSPPTPTPTPPMRGNEMLIIIIGIIFIAILISVLFSWNNKN